MGGDLTDREGAGELHTRGCTKDHGETAVERVGWEMVLSLACGSMKEAGFAEIRKSITNRQNTVAQ